MTSPECVGCRLRVGVVHRSVRPLRVVVLGVLAHHCCEVAGPGDQEVVKALPAQRADEALGDRVRPRCLDRCADDSDVRTGEDRVERGGELVVPVADQEPEPVRAGVEIHQQVAGLLSDPDTGGVSGDPAEVHVAIAVLDHEQDVEAAQEDGVDVGEADREDRAGLGG